LVNRRYTHREIDSIPANKLGLDIIKAKGKIPADYHCYGYGGCGSRWKSMEAVDDIQDNPLV